ncbi:hypothetical protein NDU88_004541 [Pleurodeles waltl]|uniref:Uncharacterized protein n=1 Tax=Pleurodeles waltl TaxID=8319 RepID=A0AAV7W5A2_PLEWA|nr:hypothetical protein NDU88_004541 [Pleurodeles waltl]
MRPTSRQYSASRRCDSLYRARNTHLEGAWPGLRQWRSLESSAPEGPAREPRPSAPAEAAGALNHPARCRKVSGAAGPPGRARQTLQPALGCLGGEENCGLSSPPKPRPRVSSGPRDAREELPGKDGEIARAPGLGGGT